MRVKLEKTSISCEVILFNNDTEKVLILSKGQTQFEYIGKTVVPIYDRGRLIEFMMGYKGEYYKSYVVGRNKEIKEIGYVLDKMNGVEILKAIEEDDIQIVEDEGDAKVLLFYFK
jgi:hypothetical protein